MYFSKLYLSLYQQIKKLYSMKGYGRMHGYKGKVTGLVITGIAIAAGLIHYYTGFSFSQKIDADKHSMLFWWITLFGLYLAAFSKEKNDDERVKAIRAKSMLVGFNLSMAVLLSISMTAWLATDFVLDAGAIMILPTFCLVFYLLFFHIGLYYDNMWDYSDEDYHMFKMKNTNRNQLSYILYIVLIAILLGLVVFEKLGGQ